MIEDGCELSVHLSDFMSNKDEYHKAIKDCVSDANFDGFTKEIHKQ